MPFLFAKSQTIQNHMSSWSKLFTHLHLKCKKYTLKKTYKRNIKLLQIAQMIRYVNTLIEFRKEKKLSTGSFLFFAFFAFEMSPKQNFTQKKMQIIQIFKYRITSQFIRLIRLCDCALYKKNASKKLKQYSG